MKAQDKKNMGVGGKKDINDPLRRSSGELPRPLGNGSAPMGPLRGARRRTRVLDQKAGRSPWAAHLPSEPHTPLRALVHCGGHGCIYNGGRGPHNPESHHSRGRTSPDRKPEFLPSEKDITEKKIFIRRLALFSWGCGSSMFSYNFSMAPWCLECS